MVTQRYETIQMLDRYLVFHYGNDHDQMPYEFGPRPALNFPIRCVTECADLNDLPKQAAALDLGCAVGRSSFEFSRYFHRVVGVDNSKSFIRAAQQIQKEGKIEYSLEEESAHIAKRIALLPKSSNSARVEFICEDAIKYVQTNNDIYHTVLAANLICRLPEPEIFLHALHRIISPKGQLIITSPYTWSEEFTTRSKWLKGKTGLDCLESILNEHFKLKKAFDMPFLLREHKRKYEWGVSQASIWTRV